MIESIGHYPRPEPAGASFRQPGGRVVITRQRGDRHGMAQADRCHRVATRRLSAGSVAIECEHQRSAV